MDTVCHFLRKFRIKSPWDPQFHLCNARERTCCQSLGEELVCLDSFTQLCGAGGCFCPLKSPASSSNGSSQEQGLLPRTWQVRHSGWMLHPSLLKVYRLQGPWRESFHSVKDRCEAGKSFGNEVAFFTRAWGNKPTDLSTDVHIKTHKIWHAS